MTQTLLYPSNCTGHIALLALFQLGFSTVQIPHLGSFSWTGGPEASQGQRTGATLWTWHRSWGRWVLGQDLGSDVPPRRPVPVTSWSTISTQWWQPWSRRPANPARAGCDTWRGWRRFTARCWGRGPRGGAAMVSGRWGRAEDQLGQQTAERDGVGPEQHSTCLEPV
jgi:hypothetical protein